MRAAPLFPLPTALPSLDFFTFDMDAQRYWKNNKNAVIDSEKLDSFRFGNCVCARLRTNQSHGRSLHGAGNVICAEFWPAKVLRVAYHQQ